MMIVVMEMMLGATGSRLNSGISGDALVGDSAPHTKASAHRQRTSTSWAGIARFICVTRRLILRSRTRHAMDRFHGRGHGFGIRLRPAKAAREPLKEIVDLIAFGGPVPFYIRRIRIVCAHGNLIADIVGEFVR
jgi:hypothetical protein